MKAGNIVKEEGEGDLVHVEENTKRLNQIALCWKDIWL